MTRISIAHLREKTDAECRQLAGQYYRRARKAEHDAQALAERVRQLETELNRMRGLAADIIGESQ